MAIVQISKIQQRSGNIVDLPQLDEAEFGFATDAKKLYIGKTTPNENIEVLTSYSNISFSQIEGATGNLDIDSANVADGQVLAYDGNNWVDRGGDVGGLLTLGDVANVKITGGAIGYVLETDGTGNLSWTPKSTITSTILNASNANPVVVTTAEENFFTQASVVTITAPGGSGTIGNLINGGNYYIDVLSASSFALYSDVSLTTPIDGSGENAYPYTSVTNTTITTNIITVGDTTEFTANDPVVFVGTTFGGIVEGTQYYIKTLPSGTTMTISESIGGDAVELTTASGTCNVYVNTGRVISAVGGSGTTTAGGSNTSIQFNNNNIIDGSANLVFDFANNILTLSGNAIVSNLNTSGTVTASRLVSNISTGTAPLTVTSTTRVANLSVDYANVSDFAVVTAQTTGTFYPVFVNGSSTANRALGANANISFNAATGNLNTTLLNVTGNANVGNIGATAGVFTTVTGSLVTAAQPNITSIGTLTSLGVSGNITAANITANTGIFAGNGSGLTALNASNISSGTLAQARLANASVTLGSTSLTLGSTVTSVTGLTSVTSTTFVGALTGAATSATTAGTVTTAAQPNITSVGTLTSLGVSGNITAANITANTGIFAGNGSGLTALNASNLSSGTVPSARLSGSYSISVTSATTAGTLTTAAQPNITSVGTLTSLDVTGNVTAGNIITGGGSGGNITGANLISANFFAGTVTTAAQPNITSLGTLTGLTLANASVISMGSNANVGTFTGNFTLSAGSRLTATYADLAEYYEADQNYEPGTVLEFGGEKEVTIASDETRRVAGVVSTNPAYAMNAECPGHAVAIALQGRVPVKVRGTIRKGDMLVSGGNGYAIPTHDPKMGTVIGKALENFEGTNGIIEIAVGRL